jgi:hypothetical protein
LIEPAARQKWGKIRFMLETAGGIVLAVLFFAVLPHIFDPPSIKAASRPL